MNDFREKKKAENGNRGEEDGDMEQLEEEMKRGRSVIFIFGYKTCIFLETLKSRELLWCSYETDFFEKVNFNLNV